MARGAIAALVIAGFSAAAFGGFAVESAPAVQADPLQAAIFPGTCRRPQTTASWDLVELNRPNGRVVRGVPFYSETRLPVDLATLQGEPFAMIVSRTANHPDNAVACGDLNSLTTDDGATMLVGLLEQRSSLHTGVATLTADGNETIVRAFISRARAGGFAIDSGVDSGEGGEEVGATINVTITEDGLIVDQSTIFVDQTVEFVVRNEGEERHEAILEESGALEAPFENADGSQTETEDLAPNEEASFVYTFDRPGIYQIADHIGENFDLGFWAEIEVVEE
jgi:hypothetical protein